MVEAPKEENDKLGEEDKAPEEDKYENLTDDDIELIDKVFSVFDSQSDNTIEISKLITALRWLQENPTDREV